MELGHILDLCERHLSPSIFYLVYNAWHGHRMGGMERRVLVSYRIPLSPGILRLKMGNPKLTNRIGTEQHGLGSSERHICHLTQHISRMESLSKLRDMGNDGFNGQDDDGGGHSGHSRDTIPHCPYYLRVSTLGGQRPEEGEEHLGLM